MIIKIKRSLAKLLNIKPKQLFYHVTIIIILIITITIIINMVNINIIIIVIIIIIIIICDRINGRTYD